MRVSVGVGVGVRVRFRAWARVWVRVGVRVSAAPAACSARKGSATSCAISRPTANSAPTLAPVRRSRERGYGMAMSAADERAAQEERSPMRSSRPTYPPSSPSSSRLASTERSTPPVPSSTAAGATSSTSTKGKATMPPHTSAPAPNCSRVVPTTPFACVTRPASSRRRCSRNSRAQWSVTSLLRSGVISAISTVGGGCWLAARRRVSAAQHRLPTSRPTSSMGTSVPKSNVAARKRYDSHRNGQTRKTSQASSTMRCTRRCARLRAHATSPRRRRASDVSSQNSSAW